MLKHGRHRACIALAHPLPHMVCMRMSLLHLGPSRVCRRLVVCPGHQLGLANGHDHAQKEGADNKSTEMVPVGQQKGDGMYYIVSPEFTGGLGNHEARALPKIVKTCPSCTSQSVACFGH